MIKRFSKKQGSKQGIILLTVVFILAMAVIFISACMVMTQATRNRLYWKAEQSQARLTVTSAAEAFYQALEVGDFKESQLKTLALAKASGILMTAKDSSGNYLPGMSLSTDNCTTLSLKAKDDKCSEIYAYLKTTIDGEEEKVKITFKVKSKPKVYGLFGNPVDYNGTATNLNFDDFGFDHGTNAEDNFIVIRDGGSMADSSSKIYSNIVFTGGTITKFQAKLYDSDFILLGDAKVAIDANVDAGASSWYFVSTPGNVKDALAADQMINQLNASTAVVFANRNVNKSITNLSPAVYKMTIDVSGNASGTTLLGGSAVSTETMTTLTDNAAKYSSADFVASIGSFPTTSEAFSQIKLGEDSLPTTAPDSFKAMTLDAFKTAYGYTSATGVFCVGDDDKNGTVENPNIKIQAPGSIGNVNGDGPADTSYLFLLDGSTDYVIYLCGTGTYYFHQCTFAVVNPSSDHQQVFVLENGVKLEIGNQNAKGIGAGFLSVKRDDYTNTASSYATYLFGNNLLTEQSTTQSSGGKYSNYYDSVRKPTIYLLGAGSNDVKFYKESTFEGYLGLFNPDSTTKSHVNCYNPSTYVYGRMMFDGFTTADGGNINMPYCPGPNTGGTKPDVELYKFGYTVVSVDYYYTDTP